MNRLLLFSLTFLIGAHGLCFSAEKTEEKAQDDKKPKNKPHFVGVRRPAEKSMDKKRSSSAIKNPWVKSKTHPKDKKDKPQPKANKEEEPSSNIPHFSRQAILPSFGGNSLLFPETTSPPPFPESFSYESMPDGDAYYPRLGKDAPNGHVYFTVDWLFWRTRESSMEFVVHGASSSSSAPFPDSATSKCNFDLTSGFRTGFGVHLPTDGWDIYVNYTDFRPKASKSVDGFLFPLLLYHPPTLAASAHAEWKITFQTLDIEIGRDYFIGRTLSLRPFIGMTGAWIDQKTEIDYDANTLFARTDFKGAGPRLGIRSNWHLAKDLSLFSNGGLVLAVGHFDLKNHQSQGGVETIHLTSDLNLISPTLSLIAGLSWDRNFQRDTRHVGISAGFETQYWWRQNQLERFTDSAIPLFVRADGDLAFYGLTLRGRFDF